VPLSCGNVNCNSSTLIVNWVQLSGECRRPDSNSATLLRPCSLGKTYKSNFKIQTYNPQTDAKLSQPVSRDSAGPDSNVPLLKQASNLQEGCAARGKGRLADSSWNEMIHGDAREGKWRGNWRMEWVASTLHTTSEHGVSSVTTADAHNSATSSRLNWRPRRFKWTRPFRQKTKSGFCVEMWWHTVTHGWGSEGETGEWSG